jgi:hypothetical protein
MRLRRAFLIVAGYGLKDRRVGLRVPIGSRFCLVYVVQVGSEPHPAPMLRVQGVKRPGHEANHSITTIVEVKIKRIYTSTPPNASLAYCLIS